MWEFIQGQMKYMFESASHFDAIAILLFLLSLSSRIQSLHSRLGKIEQQLKERSNSN